MPMLRVLDIALSAVCWGLATIFALWYVLVALSCVAAVKDVYNVELLHSLMCNWTTVIVFTTTFALVSFALGVVVGMRNLPRCEVVERCRLIFIVSGWFVLLPVLGLFSYLFVPVSGSIRVAIIFNTVPAMLAALWCAMFFLGKWSAPVIHKGR